MLAQQHNMPSSHSHGGGGGSGNGGGFNEGPLIGMGYNNWPPNFGETVAAVKNRTGQGVTYYWGSHQVGESVLAFSKDRFTAQMPVSVYRTINYQNAQSRISYLEVYVKNAATPDQVFVSSGGIGSTSISVYIGSQNPTTYFEFKATLFGFE